MNLNLILLLFLFYLVLPASAQQGLRRLSREELVSLTKIDPAYKNQVTIDDSGRYVDNNPDDYYLNLKAKAESSKRGILVNPEGGQDASSILKEIYEVRLPPVLLTGNEVDDISHYKEIIILWLQENKQNVKYLEPQIQGLINSENYQGLFKTQVVANNVTKQ